VCLADELTTLPETELLRYLVSRIISSLRNYPGTQHEVTFDLSSIGVVTSSTKREWLKPATSLKPELVVEWIGNVILAMIVIAIVFEVLKGVAAFLVKVAKWIVGPKEWFGSLLLWGALNPRARTVLLVWLILLVACSLLLVLLITTQPEWLGIALMCAVLFIPLGCKKLWAYFREREHVAVQAKRDERAHQLKSALASRGTPLDFPFTSGLSNLPTASRAKPFTRTQNSSIQDGGRRGRKNLRKVRISRSYWPSL